MSAIYIAITSHGFGHAVRAASVAAEIQRLNPNISLILVTTAPEWLLKSYIPGDFIYRHRAFDVGVIQSDSINMDKKATFHKLLEIQKNQDAIINEEVKFIQENNVKLIIGDIPFLAPIMGKKAGIPTWMISNFGWDFIYRDWGEKFTEIADWISDCYSKSDRLLRLPFHESMSAFPVIADMGLTVGMPKYSFEELKSYLDIDTEKEKTILLTFGGLGLDAIPYDNISNFSDWQFITFDKNAPDLPNLIKISGVNYRPVDIMPICGRIISKPGYSTFSEAIRLNVPIISLMRKGFAESPLLMEGIANYAEHQIINQSEFFLGKWEFLYKEMEKPRKTDEIDKQGTEAIARQVVHFLKR